jgi:ABC-type Fe3+/spermidine/putrescine transport system ATPase subunit
MITIENLTKRYEKTAALEEITFELSDSEILGVVGPSGCGKTTLLRLIAGLERPDSGRILINGIEMSTPARLTMPHKRGLSMIFQDLALWPHMTVSDHIRFVLGRNPLSVEDINTKTRMILENVNLIGYDQRHPNKLSGGEKQRLAIARALASAPEYLLMDEPFSNLDSILRDELQALIAGLKNSHHLGIVYVTHQVEDALAVADRIAIMNEGRLVQIDQKQNIINNPKTEFVRCFLRIN